MKKVIPLTQANLEKKYTVTKADDADEERKSDVSSSLNSTHNKVELTEEQKGSLEDARLARKSAFIAHRNELRDRILKEVMDSVMPDAGAYDIDGMTKAKVRSSNGTLIKILKFVGLMDLDLHEAVLSGSEYHVKRAIKKIETVNKNSPEHALSIINQYDGNGRTALTIAVITGNLKLVDFLIEHKAMADVCDESTGRTPLMYSVMGRKIEISHKLLHHGGTAQMSDYKCVTPLMLAASQNDLRHCKLLLKNNANVDDQDENGWTCLHYAVQADASEIVEYLLQEGADRTIRDVNKRRPLDFARYKNYGECIAQLSMGDKVRLA